MGIFDAVRFTCPTCAAAIEVQSKAESSDEGPFMRRFDPDTTPLYIALDIAGETVRCECGAVWRVVAEPPFPTAVTLRLVAREEAP